jgi:general secretion pathway protein H
MTSLARIQSNARTEDGFSLVEMLIVLVIIGLATSVVMLTGASGSPGLAVEADRFAGRVAAARDAALIHNKAVRIDISSDGYHVLAETRSGWQEIEAPVFWQEGTSVSHSSGRLPAVLSFDNTGMADAASLSFFRGGATETVRVDSTGNITREERYAP